MRYLITAIILGMCSASWAQIEVNVKIRQDASMLKSYFSHTLKSQPVQAVIAETAYPFLPKVRSAIALASTSQSRLDEIYTLTFPTKNTDSLLVALAESEAFEFIEINRTRKIHQNSYTSFTPNDDSLQAQWYLPFIQAPAAWELSRGKGSIKVGVIDTGLDFDHPEFKGQLAINLAEDANANGTFEPWSSNEVRNGVRGDFNGLDEDQNGFPDDVVGYDFTDQPRSPFGGDFVFADPYPEDDNFHGTAVAGLISAQMDNEQGIAGLAPDCKLMVLRAFAANGAGEDDDIARAIVYAADNGVKVLNFSFGDVFASQITREAIRYAAQKGVIMVASAGNGTGDDLHYPSGYPEVISVSATTRDPNNGFESLWQLSSFGLTVDLAAPGADILTTDLTDTLARNEIIRYGRYSGTSFAAPMVAATAALLLSMDSTLSPDAIRSILTTTTDDISRPGWDHFTGAGRLNMARAVTAAGGGKVEIVSPIHDEGSNLDTIPITGTVLAPTFQSYSLYYQAGTEDTSTWQPIVSDEVRQIRADTLAIWQIDTLPEGLYTLRLAARLSNGSTLEDRIRFVIDRSVPKTSIRVADLTWDNEQRAFLIVFRSSDPARHILHFREQGTTDWQQVAFDRLTRNGEFLLTSELLTDGIYEWFIEAVNAVGLSAQTDIQSFTFQQKTIPQTTFKELPYGLPLGRMLETPSDMDQDGLLEVVMSPFDAGLSLTQIGYYEFRGDSFVKVDSLTFKEVLLPKDLADTDNDGLWELFCSVNDSNYLVEQADKQTFPQQIIWREEGKGRFAARFGDTDNDNQLELLLKDFEDYFIFEGSGSTYDSTARLIDNSGNYQGSIAPRALVGDFDLDGKQEVVYGDADGDVLVYESLGDNNYERIFLDTTDFRNSGNYLCQGDFDGDGQEEIFVAAHLNTNLRNQDNEYDPFFVWMRILKGIGDNQFEVIWEDYLYDLDLERTNAATAASLLNNGRDQLIVTTFPRTYVLDWRQGQMTPIWFYYGSLASHHVVGDFNDNGIPELGLGLIDSTKCFEWDLGVAAGPASVEDLSGVVLDASRVQLKWSAASGATSYQIWRVRNPRQNDLASVINGYLGTTFTDQNLEEGVEYLYILKSNNPQLDSAESGFGNTVLLLPHQPAGIDSVIPVNDRQILVYFSYPVLDLASNPAHFVLDGERSPASIIGGGLPTRSLLLSFQEPFLPGTHVLEVNEVFLDADRAYIDPLRRIGSFLWAPPTEDCVILNAWEKQDASSVRLFFDRKMASSALEGENYQVRPTGSVAAISWLDDTQTGVEIRLSEAIQIGALGNPVSVLVTNVCAADGTCICPEGRIATFTEFQSALTNVFVYPNPVQSRDLAAETRFANLTREATIEIYTQSGRLVKRLSETDGDGGVVWNLLDREQKRITPGVYIYRVYTGVAGEAEFVGTFSVVD